MINTAVLIKRHYPHGGAHGEIIIGAAKAGISLFGAGNDAGDDAFNIAINGNGQYGALEQLRLHIDAIRRADQREGERE